MALWKDRILPWFVHAALRTTEFQEVRSEYLGKAEGQVLEIGFGSGLNLPHLSDRVRKLYAVEPADAAWRIARATVERAPFPVERTGTTAEAIPLPDGSVDEVISSFSLCTIPDAEKALREVRRVLRPGGTFRFVEHGRSEDARIAKWQDRLDPVQQWLAGGCHLNREPDRLLREAGFRIERLDRFEIPGPRVIMSLYGGAAIISSCSTSKSAVSED
ncbi:MAG TPA: class I SAM-dependent methyltransferase [Thermoanaerobaculia bacterium]|nr:class I SAM-dependent methyltransferase [Thermoanaerobaculia bacterium]